MNDIPIPGAIPPEPYNLEIDSVISRVQAGDIGAFEEIVHAYEWPLRSFFHVRCPENSDPDDIAQETFIVVFQKISQYAPGTNFRAWLFSIARFQLLAECKRQKRRNRFWKRYEDHTEITAPVETPFAEEAIADHLKACLNRLDEKGRQVIHWRYHSEKSIKEIASLRERSEGAIKKQLHVLRGRIESCLKQKMEGAEA